MKILEVLSTIFETTAFPEFTLGNLVMIGIALLLLYIAVDRDVEPILLVPIAFGIILGNIPVSKTGIVSEGSFLYYIKKGLELGIYPPLVFLGVGALTDFSFMMSSPITIFLGAAAQMGIFFTFLVAKFLGFSLKQAASIAIIGGADGPTAIFTTATLAPELVAPVAISAYSYIALIPVLQPIASKLLTSKEERAIRMSPPRHVTRFERLMFPIVVTILSAVFVPKSLVLVGPLMLGNFLREVGTVKRLVEAAGRYILDTATILLMLSVGVKAQADTFLTTESLKIFFLGATAFFVSLSSGILFAKLMNLFLKEKINPLIGVAGVSAVPNAARVAQRLAHEVDHQNFILMHAMGPNVAGVIGSAVVAGVFMTFLS